MPREIEASVQMKLYTLTKRQLAVVVCVFLLSFIITVVVGIAGPAVTYESSEVVRIKPSLHDPQMCSFTVVTRLPLTPFNQQLWLLMQPSLPTSNTELLAQDSDLSPRNSELSAHGNIEVDIETTVIIHSDNANDELMIGRRTTHTRHITCDQESCSKLILVHLGYINNETYKVTVEIKGLLNGETASLRFLTFTFACYKSAFTQYEIWFRVTFLIITCFVNVMFSRSLREFSFKDWTVEQRWNSILLPLLLLYNNPIFALNFLAQNFLPSYLVDGVFQATFLSALLFYWLCLFHSFTQTSRTFLKFYLPKLILISLIWLSSVVISTWQSIHESNDPTFNFKIDTVNFTGFKIFLIVLSALFCLLFLYFLIKSFIQLRNVAYFNIRLKFNSLLIIFILTISITVLMLRFGTRVLDENFVSDITTRYKNSVEFVSLYGLLNIYMFTVSYIYSPAKNARTESRLHDNPLVSMLNESDDDVVYGTSERDNFISKFNAEFD